MAVVVGLETGATLHPGCRLAACTCLAGRVQVQIWALPGGSGTAQVQPGGCTCSAGRVQVQFFFPEGSTLGFGCSLAAALAYFMSKVAPSRLLCKTNQPVLPPKLNVDPILALYNIVTTLQTTLGALQSS